MDTRARLRDFAARVHATASNAEAWTCDRSKLKLEAAAIIDDLVEEAQHEIAERRTEIKGMVYMHEYRPFTTRDGRQECADCHSPKDHPIHR